MREINMYHVITPIMGLLSHSKATRLEGRLVRFVGVWQERASAVEGLDVNIYNTNIELTFSQ